MSDEQGRPDLSEFADQFDERLYNVGRLDGDTSGLLLLTNDGELANVMAHPRFGVEKTYVAKVRGRVKQPTLARLMRGVELDDGPIAADRARILSTTAQGGTLLEVTLHSGRNRIVRRMLDAVGHPVIELVRRQFGPLHLGTLSSGQMRDLTKMELGQILTLMRADESGADTETDSVEADAGLADADLADAQREIENGGS
jgi:23S rRNA pseudouridine2605 synthase/16S rRNA pseudouridine516 synthase